MNGFYLIANQVIYIGPMLCLLHALLHSDLEVKVIVKFLGEIFWKMSITGMHEWIYILPTKMVDMESQFFHYLKVKVRKTMCMLYQMCING